MVKETKYYDLLDIPPNSNENEIKKAYRKMSIKWHPDKNPDNKEQATKKFQEISEAYSVLSDDEKRKQYDQFGKEGMEQMNSGPDIDPNDLFSQFFGEGNPFGGNPFGGNPFGGSFNFQNRNQPKKEHITNEIKIPLKSIYNEETITINYEQKIYCNDCDGTGNIHKEVPDCPHCNGTGVKTTIRRMGPMITQQTAPCNECNGTGKKNTKKEDDCKTCDGKGYTIKKQSIQLPLKNGLSTGNKIHLEGLGHSFKDYNTDLFLIIKVEEDEKFKRNGDDLVIQVQIELFQSLFGFNKIIKHIDGNLIHVSTKEITKDDSYKKIKGLGMKNMNSGRSGDLILNFKIVYPKQKIFNEDDKKSIINILSKNNQKELKLEKEIKSSIKNSNLREDQSPNMPFKTYKMENIKNQVDEDNEESPPECIHQ